MNNSKTSTPDLRSLVEAVTGKELFQVSTVCYVSRMVVLILEMERMSAYRPELLPVLSVLEQVEQMSSHFACDSFAITEFDEGLFFDILHGKTVTETTMEVLNYFLVENLTSIYDTAAIRPMFGPAPIDSYSPAQLAEYRALNVGAVVASRENPGASDFWDEVMELQQAA
ncbi:hypothetical protein D3C86_1618020 [compost metagenome]